MTATSCDDVFDQLVALRLRQLAQGGGEGAPVLDGQDDVLRLLGFAGLDEPSGVPAGEVRLPVKAGDEVLGDGEGVRRQGGVLSRPRAASTRVRVSWTTSSASCGSPSRESV